MNVSCYIFPIVLTSSLNQWTHCILDTGHLSNIFAIILCQIRFYRGKLVLGCLYKATKSKITTSCLDKLFSQVEEAGAA